MGELRFVVDSQQPVTVQNFLRNGNGISARLLKKLKNRKGGITCNGEPIRSIDTVKAGDVLVLTTDDCAKAEPNGNVRADIAFENESLVVFNKPAGMPVHQSVRHRDDTLANYFAYLYPELTFRAVNRLDKDTSGLCVIAKDPHTANLLQGESEKVYYAAVHGVTDVSGTIDAPIARECESIIRRCVRDDGKRAVTHYKRIACNGKYSLLEIHLETGRTHQIRVHFAHIGHPLAGDDMYGGTLEDIGRQALHCGSLSLILPMTGEKVTVTSPLPDDILKLMEENEMEKIASFQVDHTKFGVGMYISRIDGDIITYDVRMVKPNGGVYVSNPSLHTIEHLFATFARNSRFRDSIIYVGPMGCRTGFYLLTRNTMSGEDAIALVREAYRFIADYNDEIPGCTAVECGNYLEHDLASAKKDVLPLLEKLEGYTAEMLDYSYHF